MLMQRHNNMKTFICLLMLLHTVMGGATVGWSGGQAGSGSTTIYKVVTLPGGGHGGHGHVETGPHIVKIILEQGAETISNHIDDSHHGGGGDYGYSDGHATVFKVIHESHGSHSHSSHGGPSSRLNALLPQILQIILEDDNKVGSVNDQILRAYGHKGSATATLTKGQPSHYLKGGKVVQKGTLQLTRVDDNAGFGGKLMGLGSSSPVYSSSPPHPHEGWS